MKSYAQAGQDIFAFLRNNSRSSGVFLDIGCNHPTENNNTYALELAGWTGLNVDIAPFDYSKRVTPFHQCDAKFPDVTIFNFLKRHGLKIDYLSVDADDDTVRVLQTLPLDTCKFNVITIEHDVYRKGTSDKVQIYNILRSHGYRRERDNVLAPRCDGMPWSEQPYEDWYVL
jgi:hypothetical protein